MRRHFMISILCLISLTAFCQERPVFGAVISADTGRPLDGVKVILLEVKMVRKTKELVFVESRNRTKTNNKGEYALSLSLLQENKIRFRKEGYETVEIDPGRRKRIDITMKLAENK